MKLCQNCSQSVAGNVASCPNCGNEIKEGRKHIDDYLILSVLHEGYSSILCKAVKEGGESPVMIRIFTSNSGVDEKVAARLKRELEELKKLPEEYFVRHCEIRYSSDGLWYRVSEWVDAENWGTLISSGQFQDYHTAFSIFYKIASILEGLHRIGHIIPHLTLDDIMLFKNQEGGLEVKIDYKLSRFINPQIDRPTPMLKKLLNCHPDIIGQRPLDSRSDIWSLGKIFVELLSGDPDINDFSGKAGELPLPPKIKTLIKVMLAEDSSLRPSSMAEVAESLKKVTNRDIKAARAKQIESASAPIKAVNKLKKKAIFFGMLFVLMIIGGLSWNYLSVNRKGPDAVFRDFVDRFAKSVAFVTVEYSIRDNNDIYYQSRKEGTAFLVDKEGYLLTNRHVLCPWLEDRSFFLIANSLRRQGKSPFMAYRIFLWFEGEKAFKRLPNLTGTPDLEDIYDIESAFSTDKTPRLSIAGVSQAPVKTWQIVKSPLKDDFAVIKIEKVPEGLKPLPVDLEMDVRKIPKLSPIITLGFPLGSHIQENTINVSVTRGNVRRTFESMFQVDTSIHRGNSGGPVIDARGKVIGIASKVVFEWAEAPVPVATSQSDIGLVLPVTKAVSFIQALKKGDMKWNGVLDLTVDEKLKNIREIARERRWADAQTLADKEVKLNPDPTMIMAAGILHYCAGDTQGSKNYLRQAVSIDRENNTAKFLLYWINRSAGKTGEDSYRRELLGMDWRSPGEFSGYLVRVAEGQIEANKALAGGYSDAEKSWLHYVVGLTRQKQNDLLSSEELFKKALLSSELDDWVYFLALSGLQQVQKDRLKLIGNRRAEAGYQAAVVRFQQELRERYRHKTNQLFQLITIVTSIDQKEISLEKKRSMLIKLLEYNYNRGETLSRLAFTFAMDNMWDSALESARSFLAIAGRENMNRLSIQLLIPEIYYNMGRKDEALSNLERLLPTLDDEWFRSICEALLSRKSESSLLGETGGHPENLLTAHAAMGFWAEGSGDREKALRHYKEVLGSYMDERIEFDFAIARIQRLKKEK